MAKPRRRKQVSETIVGEIGYAGLHSGPVVHNGTGLLDLDPHLRPGSRAVVLADKAGDVDVLVVVRGNPDASKVEEAIRTALAKRPGRKHAQWQRQMGDAAQAVTRGLWR